MGTMINPAYSFSASPAQAPKFSGVRATNRVADKTVVIDIDPDDDNRFIVDYRGPSPYAENWGQWVKLLYNMEGSQVARGLSKEVRTLFSILPSIDILQNSQSPWPDLLLNRTQEARQNIIDNVDLQRMESLLDATTLAKKPILKQLIDWLSGRSDAGRQASEENLKLSERLADTRPEIEVYTDEHDLNLPRGVRLKYHYA